MGNTENTILKDAQRGATVEADGNAPAESVQVGGGVSLALDSQNDPHAALGPNNELLEQAAPRLVNALRELVVKFREEGIVARRHEIRRIRQARLFWQGLQYAWWNPQDMNWHLPWEAKIYDDSALAEMPRYQFVTNLYQAFGLSFVSVISQDVPATRFYPQSTLSEADIETAKAASQVADLIEQNNRVQQLLTGLGFFLWTDGKIGGYVRYVADGQRFGWRDELVLEERWVRLGRDAYVCPNCGAETEVGNEGSAEQQRDSSGPQGGPQNDNNVQGGAAEYATGPVTSDVGAPWATSAQRDFSGGENGRQNDSASGLGRRASFLTGTICANCGAVLGPKDFRPAPVAPVPQGVGTRRVANGQEVISIVGGLELNTPVWANEQYEFPYLQWQMEVHRAKLKAAFPQAADKIQTGGPQAADDIYARATRVAVAQGMPTTHPGDALFNLITFSRTWIRPWAFYSIEDTGVRDQLLLMFPEGCYVAFAGETYCESRNESMDDCWRVMHALPGDGQNRPSVGDSLIEVQERYNTLSNIQAETYEYGIPPIYADPQVLDFDALSNQTAEPAAHYPARARPGMSLADGFFQPAPAQVPPDMLRHQQDLMGPIAQFLTGLFPAVFGGEMENVKTASGYAMARDQALGRLGLVWRRLKSFYSDLMLLSVDCFRKNRPGDVEIPFLGAGGEFEARFIRLADLKGNIQAHPESDETFPRLKSQQRAVLQQLMSNPDPTIQAALREPANLGFIKSLVGLSELVVPGDDARNKQLREIQALLAAGPVIMAPDEGVSDRSEESGAAAGSGAGGAGKAGNARGWRGATEEVRRSTMQQGSNAGAGLAARTAGMTDEQILDLDLAQFAAGAPEILPEVGGEPELWDLPQAPTSSTAGPLDGQAPGTSLSPESAVMTSLSAESSTSRRLSAHDNLQTLQPTPPGRASRSASAQSDPAWLKQLETQPQAAAEARKWRDAASDVAALDAAYFGGDATARSGLASRLYESDPAAFREMLAESARMLATRDPQALAELARQLGMSEQLAPNGTAKSLAQAARTQQNGAAVQNLASASLRGNAGNQGSSEAAFPTEAYRTFESATNQDVARQTREAIDRTLSATLPEGVSDGARRRIGDDVFRELHATLSADRELSRQVSEILGGWRFDGATKQQIVSLISGRARAAMPEVARRVVGEWTSSVLASDRARAARVDAAAARRDITGGRLPEAVPASALRPRNIDYSRLSDEQILDL